MDKPPNAAQPIAHRPSNSAGLTSRLVTTLLIGSLLLFLAIQVRRAWLSDDAFITFRTIDNFLNGFGLVWNPGERVQTYTHPLWMLLLSLTAFFTRELVFTSLLLSLLITLTTLLLIITRLAVSTLTALFVTLIALLSNAFVDYSSSGLENPLSHLLLALFFILYFNGTTSIKRLFWMSCVASLGALNRLDLILLFAPVLMLELLEIRRWQGFLALAAGQFPLLLWLLFSLFYYGFPFPNTAYAKLNTGIAELDLVRQGVFYLLNSLRSDPLTLVVISSAVLLAFLTKKKQLMGIAVGVILYLAYLVWIGGDFMSGRFLAAPLVCSLVILARFDLASLARWQSAVLFTVIIALGILSPTPTLNFWEQDLTAKQRSAMVNDSKISNERRFYGWATALLRLDPKTGIPDHPYALDGLEARQKGSKLARRITVGMFGYYAGPLIHVVDELALGDALLARLPARRDINWRVGHFQRTIPDGYLDTLRSGEIQISDARLATYYAYLRTIIQDALLSPGRINAIWKMNTRQFASLIDFDTYRYPKLVQVNLDEISQAKPAGAGWNAPGNFVFGDSGIEIVMGGIVRPTALELSLNGDNTYELQYLKDGKIIDRQKLTSVDHEDGLTVACLELPIVVRQAGFDHVRIFPISGNGEFSLGHLLPEACKIQGLGKENRALDAGKHIQMKIAEEAL